MKLFVASFNRASDGAISKLVKTLYKNEMISTNYNDADYILAVGDRVETFDFVLERFKENKKIIHLWAGEISCWSTHDDIYRHSMTLMSCLQLCTNPTSKKRVELLCKSVDKKPNAFVVGNVMLDNFELDETDIPNQKYDLVLYNSPTSLSREEIYKEIEQIQDILKSMKHIWIAPNGDKFSDIVFPYQNQETLPRKKFLGLMKNCDRFITNSSCQYYEAQFLLKPEQIISIGKRNIKRESRYADMTIKGATENIIKILKELK